MLKNIFAQILCGFCVGSVLLTIGVFIGTCLRIAERGERNE